jgi:hypothetical protein
MLLFQMEACMPIARDFRLGRRDFLQMASAGGLALGLGARPASAQDDEANFHGMLMFGEESVFFSHLPMFEGLNEKGTDYASPHRYQVILEAAFTKEQRDAYAKNRKDNPGAPFYSIKPKPFVLSQLFTPTTAPQLTSFACDVCRGHFERPTCQKVAGLQGAQIKIGRVVHGRKFDPRASKPDALEYLLFGRGKERFLAHAIFAPPDFDHILAVQSLSAELSDADLSKDVRIVIPDRKNVLAQRLRQGQRVEALLRIGSGQPAKIQIEPGRRIYFEEGELRESPEMKDTDEEKKDAG